MAKNNYVKSLESEIENALDLGQFISYKQAWDFIEDLEKVQTKIDALVSSGEAERAVQLYEIFLSGCYEKAEEIDDSGGNLGMFFEELFCAWIEARQKAKYPPEETIQHVISWMDNDDYGFCYEIEKSVVKILNAKGVKIFEKRIKEKFERAFSSVRSEKDKLIYDYPFVIRENAGILKVIYIKRKDIKAYRDLCAKIGVTPKDCEEIAKLYQVKRQFNDAIIWTEKGLGLEKKRNWPNQSSFLLKDLKRELLRKLGREDDALQMAWSEFKDYPSAISYDELMKYVPKANFKDWHEKAMDEAGRATLSAFIELCLKTKELDKLAKRIIAAKDEELEIISHYILKEAAKPLVKYHTPATAKIYRALGMRIIQSGKSKYYRIALDHFDKARQLYKKTNEENKWLSLIEIVRKDHSRKYTFIGDFEKVVAGNYLKSKARNSFRKITRRRWEKQISRRDG